MSSVTARTWHPFSVCSAVFALARMTISSCRESWTPLRHCFVGVNVYVVFTCLLCGIPRVLPWLHCRACRSPIDTTLCGPLHSPSMCTLPVGQAADSVFSVRVPEKLGLCCSRYFFPFLLEQGNPDHKPGPWTWQQIALHVQ